MNKEFLVTSSLDTLKTKLLEIHHIKDAAALLSWDQETYMPSGGGQARADQLATLQTIAHTQLVSAEMESLLTSWVNPDTGLVDPSHDHLDESTTALLRETWRDFSRAKKLPSNFVTRLERECSLAQQVWITARANNDFPSFAPHLRTIVSLKQEEAQYLGFVESPYNALLDTFEPGATIAQLQPLFATLREGLISLLARIRQAPSPPTDDMLHQSFAHDPQLEFGRLVLTKMGYDFSRGRLDLSAHPFTTSFHPHDVRVTTRVFDKDLPSCLFSCIHEGGHGLYEQGLAPANYGTALGEAISLGIHESQSRFWENCIGRSRPFWQYFFPLLQDLFPQQLGTISLDTFYRAINVVKPSLIRVEADEVTYNLHIMMRFEVELDLLENRVQVNQLPELWRAKMQEYVGITPDTNADGVLQDVHWSFGAIGYFPTYTLGNLYAAMLYKQALQTIPELHEHLAKGNLVPLTGWLREHIHQWGRHYTSEELILRVTGQTLSAQPFLHYLEQKIGEVYHL